MLLDKYFICLLTMILICYNSSCQESTSQLIIEKKFYNVFYKKNKSKPDAFREIVYKYHGDTIRVIENYKDINGDSILQKREVFLRKPPYIYKIKSKNNIAPYCATLSNSEIIFVPYDELTFWLYTTYKYLGQKNLRLNNIKYNNLHVFEKTNGQNDGILSLIYYNDKFQIIKQEYLEGYGRYFRIEIVE